MARILVIDDDQPFCEMMAATLQPHGHTVILFPDGRKAFKYLDTSKVDLVITDIVMPEIDGIEVLRRLRISNPTLPIIAICGNPTEAMFLKMSKLLGARHTLAKPFEATALIKAVNDVLARPPNRVEGGVEKKEG